MNHTGLPYAIEGFLVVNETNIKFLVMFGVFMNNNKLSVVLEFGLNPNCSGFRTLCCSMNLFNLFCKIDVNSFPKQLVKVIPL